MDETRQSGRAGSRQGRADRYTALIAAVTLLSTLASVTGTVAAQEAAPASQEPTIKVDVQQVLVPVIVTDRQGHFISDLKASDFQVFENGVEQKLVALSTEQNGAASLFPSEVAPPQAPGSRIALLPAARGPAIGRTYLVVVDMLNTSVGSFAQLSNALKKLFKNEQGSDSQYALVAIGRPTFVMQNLTRDPEAVLAALSNPNLLKAIKSSQTSNMGQEESELMSMLEDYCRRCQVCGRQTGATCPMLWNPIVGWANTAADHRERLTRDLIAELSGLTGQLGRLTGKRILILASDGFNFQPGRELFRIMQGYTTNPGAMFENRASNLQTEFEAIVRLATARNVTFYTLDSRGLTTNPAAGFDATGRASVDPRLAASVMPAIASAKQTSSWEQQDAMNYLAESTGGVFYRDNNDLLKGLHQAFADGREYYVLAYNSSNRLADGKYRALRVEVRDRSFVVRAKRGYWAPQAAVASSSSPPPATATLPRATAGAETAAASAPVPEKNAPITLEVPAESSALDTDTMPSLVDMPTDELVREIPQLKELEPARSQDALPSILQKVGANVAVFVARFPNITCREAVTEQRLNGPGDEPDEMYQEFRYLAVAGGSKGNMGFDEYRTDNKGKAVQRRGIESGFVITQGFVSTPLYFHPSYQPESDFRYLGQEVIGKRMTEVVAFAQKPDTRLREMFSIDGKSELLLGQGVAWIDPTDNQIVWMLKDIRSPALDIGLQFQVTQVSFGEVRFKSDSSSVWLPREVKVETRLSGVTYRNRHFYSEFKQFAVETGERQNVPLMH
ncbi:MAG TPA: VWA domain-containing protein [Terriglobia bacterium]|jgi:VWFA-related protein|nr:VWA domain-containing protein [Terriglobia bacterium]